MITTIIKRDGREVPFSVDKIANAVYQAAQALGGKDYSVSLEIANEVADYIENEILSRHIRPELSRDVELDGGGDFEPELSSCHGSCHICRAYSSRECS